MIEYCTSVNITCGFHAGDPQGMECAPRLAIQPHGATGAHPGYPDLVDLTRRALGATPSEIENDIWYQVGALSAFVRAAGGALAHVKVYTVHIAHAVREALGRHGVPLMTFGK